MMGRSHIHMGGPRRDSRGRFMRATPLPVWWLFARDLARAWPQIVVIGLVAWWLWPDVVETGLRVLGWVVASLVALALVWLAVHGCLAFRARVRRAREAARTAAAAEADSWAQWCDTERLPWAAGVWRDVAAERRGRVR